MNFKSLFIVLCSIALFASCQPGASSGDSKTKKGMVKVTILYPNAEGKTFDMDYYADKHMPMVAELLGDSLKFLKIDRGIGGRTADDQVPYLAIGYLYFDKLSEYQNAFAPHAEKIVGDIPNYTNIQPVIQISEVYE